MKAAKQSRSLRPPKLVRILQARPKLIISALLGVALAIFLPAAWGFTRRALIGWDAGVALYLSIVYWMIARAHSTHIRQHAAREDEGRGVILIITVAAAMASLAAIVIELGGHKSQTSVEPTALLLAVVTILLSWALIQSVFAVHYAYEFYAEKNPAGGLHFPGGEKPHYWDFVYFAFVVGMTFQVSDVAVTARDMRMTVTAHAIVSFVFNVALLALMVNIAASAI